MTMAKARFPTAAEIHLNKVNVLIDDLTDEDLADLKPMAMERLPNDQARKMLKDVRVRDSRWLRMLVYEIVVERK